MPPNPAEVVTNKNVVMQILKGLLVGAPIGAGAFYASKKLNPGPKLTFPEHLVSMPLIERSGPELTRNVDSENYTDASDILKIPVSADQPIVVPKRKRFRLFGPKEEPVVEKTSAAPKPASTLPDIETAGGPLVKNIYHGLKNITGLKVVSGVGGGILGYKVLQKAMEHIEAKKLDKVIAARAAMMDKLLLAEQNMASGQKVASNKITDYGEAMEVVASYYAKTAADPKGVWESFITPIGEPGGVLDQLKQLQTHPTGKTLVDLAVILGLLGGGYAGYRRMSASDPNRAMAKKIKSSLKERLAGDPNTGTAPVIIKAVPRNRIGLVPIKPGASALWNPSSGRDAISGI